MKFQANNASQIFQVQFDPYYTCEEMVASFWSHINLFGIGDIFVKACSKEE